MSNNEFILSGPKKSLQEVMSFLEPKTDVVCNWVDSTIPFHSPHVSLVGESLLECADVLCELEVLSERCGSNRSNIPKQGFVMTSIGTTTVTSKDLQDVQFWKRSVDNPILFDDSQRTLGNCLAAAPADTKIIDFSPRGLFSQWLKRNEDASSTFDKTVVVAPVFSADFTRVFRHYRRYVDGTSEAIPRFLPAYPFNTRNMSKEIENVKVRTYDQGNDRSNFGVMNNLETRFVDLSPGVDSSKDLEDVVVIHFGALSMEEQQAVGSSRENVLFVDFDETVDIVEAVVPLSIKKGIMVLVVIEPKEWKDKNDLDVAIKFTVQVQKLLTCSVQEIAAICMSRGGECPGFEYISGSLATMRLQVASLRLACTVRLHGAGMPRLTGDWDRILSAAAAGEDVLQFSPRGNIQGRRLMSSEKALSWEMPWVQEDLLYVVSGASSGIASGVLPGLAAVGVRHFLLLVNNRLPDKVSLRTLGEFGATSVTIRKCDLTDEQAVQESIKSALTDSCARRVGGVFHLAGVDTNHLEIPVSEIVLKQVASVKYHGQLTLIKCANLQSGDIFSVPGSISQLIGASGVAYAATNHACRALQLQLANQGIIAPYPILNFTEELWERSTLWHGTFRSKVLKQMRNTGMKGNAMCSFVISQLHPRATPTSNKDLCLVRFNAEMADDFLNTSSRSTLFNVLKLEQKLQMSTFPLEVTRGAGNETTRKSPAEVTASSPLAALLDALSVVTGLEKAEIQEKAGVDEFLDESFGIDSITSIQLGRRLNSYGYDVKPDTLATSTFGVVLERLEATVSLPEQHASTSTLDTGATVSVTSVEDFSETELRISVAAMKMASRGHDLASGTIVPSMWYAMNATEILGPDVKVDLHRMSTVRVRRCLLRKENVGSRVFLNFETESEESEPLLRAQASLLAERIESVPKCSSLVPQTTHSASHFYDDIVRRAGFDYKGKYRSLQQVSVRGKINHEDVNDALTNTCVEAVGSLQPQQESQVGQVEIFFVLVDAGLHPAFICGATLAPARLEMNLHVPSKTWGDLLMSTGGKFSVSSRFAKSSHSVLVFCTTAYLADVPIYTARCTCKLLPIAVGASISPQFMCCAPRHTLVCFHEAGGTSRVFDLLGRLLAPRGVRVVSYDFPQHGRRSQQSDEKVNPSLNEVIEDVLPFLQRILTNSGGTVDPFSVLGMSSGGIVAFGVIRDGLIPRGLIPTAFINMTTQPAHIPNVHVERTYDATLDNIQSVLGYYSVLAGTSLMHLDEGQTTVDHVTSVLGVVHELTTNPATALSSIDVPTFVYGLVDDPVATWSDIQTWRDLVAPGCLVGDAVRQLDSSLNHFLGLTGLEEKAFNQIFIEDDVLGDLLRT